jgi:hypothetical protein
MMFMKISFFDSEIFLIWFGYSLPCIIIIQVVEHIVLIIIVFIKFLISQFTIMNKIIVIQTSRPYC